MNKNYRHLCSLPNKHRMSLISVQNQKISWAYRIQHKNFTIVLVFISHLMKNLFRSAQLSPLQGYFSVRLYGNQTVHKSLESNSDSSTSRPTPTSNYFLRGYNQNLQGLLEVKLQIFELSFQRVQDQLNRRSKSKVMTILVNQCASWN